MLTLIYQYNMKNLVILTIANKKLNLDIVKNELTKFHECEFHEAERKAMFSKHINNKLNTKTLTYSGNMSMSYNNVKYTFLIIIPNDRSLETMFLNNRYQFCEEICKTLPIDLDDEMFHIHITGNQLLNLI